MPLAPETLARLKEVIERVINHEDAKALLAAGLESAGFAVLPRVEHMRFPVADRAPEGTGVILDVETTGFDPAQDKVIQLSMMRFSWDREGILSIEQDNLFDQLGDPGQPIPPEVVSLTGITDAMVAGRTIDPGEVRNFLDGVDLVVAHNAGFDRKFVEATFPEAGFDRLPWHCSIEQIDWKARGSASNRLEGIALAQGFVYGAHNARSDILATAFVLAQPGEDGRSAFREMLDNAKLAPVRILAKGAPFEVKDMLRDRGYRWCPAGEKICGHSKIWHRIVPGDAVSLQEEAQFLEEAFGRPVVLPAFQLSPWTRYSARGDGAEIRFCTRTNAAPIERAQAMQDLFSP